MNHKYVNSNKVFPSRMQSLFFYCINYTTIIIIIIIIPVWNNITTNSNKLKSIYLSFEVPWSVALFFVKLHVGTSASKVTRCKMLLLLLLLTWILRFVNNLLC